MTRFIKGVKRAKFSIGNITTHMAKRELSGFGPNHLTMNEKKAVAEYLKTGYKRAAVRAAYPGRRAVSQASAIFHRPPVQKELLRLMQEAGLDDESIVTRLREATQVGWGEKATHKDALRGLELALKARGWLDQKSAHLRVNIQAKAQQMPYDELVKEYTKLKATTDSLIKDGEIVASSP